MKCAVWGSPIEHSLSPTLHLAAYAELGLHGWTYDLLEVDEVTFAKAFRRLDETWRGLSLTMPLKEVALQAADHRSGTAAATGVANTLVRDADGWTAHNTDVEGIVAAVTEACGEGAPPAGGCRPLRSAVVVGSGATARSALQALHDLGVRQVAFMVRGTVRPATLDLAERLGIVATAAPLGAWTDADVVVSTVPPSSMAQVDSLPRPHLDDGAPVLLDVVYGEGDTVLQRAARELGWVLADGTAMLLHQAAAQVRLMTGLEAPVAAMRAALDREVATRRGGHGRARR